MNGRDGGSEGKRAAMVRERAAASRLGAEVRMFVERPGQFREGKVLAFFENGFVLAGPLGLFEVVPWRTVTAVTRPTPNSVVIARSGPIGRQVVLDERHFDKWSGVTGAEVLEFVSAEVRRFNADVTVSAREESAEALAALRDGQRVRLGAVDVDSEGVHAPASSVRWADLVRVVRAGNVVELYTGAARFQPALYLPARDLPDVASFLDMAAEVHRALTGRQLPVETAGAPIAKDAGSEPGLEAPNAVTDDAPNDAADDAAEVAPDDAATVDPTEVEYGTLRPPPGMSEPILASAEEKGLSGSPRWYTAQRRAVPTPERGVLALFGDGFALRSGRKVAAYHWDDVAVTTATPSRLRSGGEDGVVAFGKPDNRPLLSNRTFLDVGLHAGRLSQAHARYLLDRAVAAFTDDAPLSLGAVTVTRDGFDYDGRSVSWSSVSGVRTAPDNGPRARDHMVVELADGAEPITIRFGDLANGDAFADLVEMMTRDQS